MSRCDPRWKGTELTDRAEEPLVATSCWELEQGGDYRLIEHSRLFGLFAGRSEDTDLTGILLSRLIPPPGPTSSEGDVKLYEAVERITAQRCPVVLRSLPYVGLAYGRCYGLVDDLTYWDITIQPAPGPEGTTRIVCSTVDVTTSTVRDQEMSRLRDSLVSAITSGLEPGPTLGSFSEVLHTVVPFEQLTLQVLEGDQLRRVVSIGERKSDFPEGQVTSYEGTAFQKAVLTGAPVVVGDTRRGEFARDRQLLGIGSYVTVPLYEGERAFAALKVAFAQRYAVTEKIASLLASTAVVAAHGVKNILLYEQQTEEMHRLEQLGRQRDDFVAMVAHELRTPLTSMIAYCDLLHGSPTLRKVEIEDALTRLAQESLRLARLVDDFVQVSAIESGGLTFSFVDVDLNQIVERAIRDQSPYGGRVSFKHQTVPLVSADPHRIRQVLLNLLSNAAKFSPGGGPITVRLEHEDSWVNMSVTDTGIGIAPEDAPLLFQRFSRAPQPGVTERIEGAGLGLYISRSILEAHGGRIWAESQPGAGSTFRVALPVRTRIAVAHPPI
jgi:signal transduction histidine kinase